LTSGEPRIPCQCDSSPHYNTVRWRGGGKSTRIIRRALWSYFPGSRQPARALQRRPPRPPLSLSRTTRAEGRGGEEGDEEETWLGSALPVVGSPCRLLALLGGRSVRAAAASRASHRQIERPGERGDEKAMGVASPLGWAYAVIVNFRMGNFPAGHLSILILVRHC